MSVLIKGMEMPTSCEKCACRTSDAFGGLGCRVTGYIPLRKADQNRPDFCPLVEVPTPHGRLIDADELRKSIKESLDECHEWANEVDNDSVMYARISQSVGTFVECSLRVKSMPTIVEAEDGE